MKKSKFLRIIYLLIFLSVLIGGVWLLIKFFTPQGPDFSKQYPILSRDHIKEGISYQGYNSNPPTSGPHYENPALAKFYNQELPDEQIVHNLEHGQIWIAYRPDLAQEIIKKLKKFSGKNVIITPRSKNDTDIALVAWGILDKFNIENGTLNSQRIKDFILRYQNKGPEKL